MSEEWLKNNRIRIKDQYLETSCQLFDLADLDRDGHIDLEEFTRFMKTEAFQHMTPETEN